MSSETAGPTSGASPFWRFSLALYGRPGVPPACLELQDTCGVDVNVLLFVLWLGRQGRRLEHGHIAAILVTAEAWRQQVVVPLRTARRALKEPPAAFQGAGAEALRSRVKAVELEAERLQQEALFAAHPADRTGVAAAARTTPAENAAAYARALGTTFPEGAVNQILGALDHLGD